MAKKTHKDTLPRVRASFRQRLMAANLTETRQKAKDLKHEENVTREELIATLTAQGIAEAVLTDAAGHEVATVSIVPPGTPGIDWKAFQDAHPELKDEIEKFRKEPGEPTMRVDTRWIETTTAPEPVAVAEPVGLLRRLINR